MQGYTTGQPSTMNSIQLPTSAEESAVAAVLHSASVETDCPYAHYATQRQPRLQVSSLWMAKDISYEPLTIYGHATCREVHAN